MKGHLQHYIVTGSILIENMPLHWKRTRTLELSEDLCSLKQVIGHLGIRLDATNEVRSLNKQLRRVNAEQATFSSRKNHKHQ